jgi:ABC-type uncharacterized transport system permease subunit
MATGYVALSALFISNLTGPGAMPQALPFRALGAQLNSAIQTRTYSITPFSFNAFPYYVMIL